MNAVSRKIIKETKVRVIDTSLTTIEMHKKDVSRRLKKQEKALVTTQEKGLLGENIIKDSIRDLKITLDYLNNY